MKKSVIILCSFVLTFVSCDNSADKKQTDNNLTNQASDKGKEIKDFIPENWKVIKQVSGDLNKDNSEDVALVVQATDKNNIIINTDGLGEDTVDANPRSLIILFKDPSNNSYKQVAKNDSIIISHEDPVMLDPFADIEIKKGNLKLYFISWHSAGSWYMSNNTYVFRYQNNDFALIGAESSYTHRGSGETSEISINFLTKKYSSTVGNAFDKKVKTKTEWKTFEQKELKTLTTFSKLWTWDFNGVTTL